MDRATTGGGAVTPALATIGWDPSRTFTRDPRVRRERVTCWVCLGSRVLLEIVSWSSHLVKVRCFLCGGKGWVER